MSVLRHLRLSAMPIRKVRQMYTAKVITVSDRCFNKEREDLAGPTVKNLLEEHSYKVDDIAVVPDDKDKIIDALTSAISENFALIITTGGTGFSKRDITPECTKAVIDKEAPGISEYMRYSSMKITPRGMLSRGVSGIKNNSLIINLPGSPKAAKENLKSVISSLEHGLKMLLSHTTDCAKE